MPFPHFGYHYNSPQLISPGNNVTGTGSPIATTVCESNISQCLSYPKCHSTEAPQDYNRFSNGSALTFQQSLPHIPGFGSPNNASPILLHASNSAAYQSSTDHCGTKSIDRNNIYLPTLASQYVLRDGLADPTTWHHLAQHPYYAYDSASSFAPYGCNFDLTNSSMMRRKNATRETTGTLKNWLIEHKKNPYPTKGEKIMLAIITKMTLTQVSTWFANARRRLKKDNKMTWEPRTRSTDEEDGDTDEESDTQFGNSKIITGCHGDDVTYSPITKPKDTEPASKEEKRITSRVSGKKCSDNNSSREDSTSQESKRCSGYGGDPLPSICSLVSNIAPSKDFNSHPTPKDCTEAKSKCSKSKIWSLADTATNNKPEVENPPSSNSGHVLYNSALPSCSPFVHHFATNYSPYAVQQSPIPLYHPRALSGVVDRHIRLEETPTIGFNSHNSIPVPSFDVNVCSKEGLVMKEFVTGSKTSAKNSNDRRHY